MSEAVASASAPEIPGALRKRTSKAGVVVCPRPETFAKATWLPALAKGLGVTMRHFFTNVTSQKDIATVQYPEETVAYPHRYRGLHRLMLRDDGSVRCVACMCCPTVCPAHCITIVPEETDEKGIEKRPAIFEIDELRCVVCGLCVEACPCDAIRMDTGMHAKPVEDRAVAIETKQSMMERGILSIAKQGGEGPNWREHVAKPKDVNR